MKILALDTSSVVATVAVFDDEKLLAETVINYKKTHSEKIMPMIEEILGHCELKAKDIDLFAASVGPGSFTGLRIGLTTIKAMAQAVDKPVVGVSTLEGLAYNLPNCKGLICPIIDAQRDNVYTALYESQGNDLKEILEPQVLSITELIQLLIEKQTTVAFVGDAVDKFKSKIEVDLQGIFINVPIAVSIPRASSIGDIARKMFNEGKALEPGQLIPIYMRKSQAEKQYDEKMKKRNS